MQEELEIMRPLLEEAAKDTLVTMEQIKVGVFPANPCCLTPATCLACLYHLLIQWSLFTQQMLGQSLFYVKHCTRQGIW